MTRGIAFDGIDNFRDFGGYATTSGLGLKRGVLYRSGHHAAASDADLARLAALGIGVIVDLRRPNERQQQPSRRWPGFAAAVVDNDLAQEHMIEWLEFLAGSDLSVASFRSYMLDYYKAAPFHARYVDLYSRYFRALAETDGAILVHCAAGKDRTGVICALTHHLAGVHPDDIVADYLLTNDPVRIAARAEMLKPIIHEHTGRLISDAALRYAIGVEAEFLDASFAAMRERHGSIDGYLEARLGLGPELRERIHARVLG
jgi:protein tyrosine/serine phosphatase